VQVEDAVAELEEAMRLEPGSPNAAFMAAIHYLRLRRDEQAMRAMDRAIALAPDYHMIRTEESGPSGAGTARRVT
jgi:Flp pilus assembly protein TadD